MHISLTLKYELWSQLNLNEVETSLHGFIWNQHDGQLPVGLLAQLIECCTGIAEVIGSNTVQAWIFSRPYLHHCSSSVHYCKDLFHIQVWNFILHNNTLLEYDFIFICWLYGTHDYHMCLNPLTPKLSWVILLIVCHTIYVMLVWRIWNRINQ